jgi:hypothetical protein
MRRQMVVRNLRTICADEQLNNREYRAELDCEQHDALDRLHHKND